LALILSLAAVLNGSGWPIWSDGSTKVEAICAWFAVAALTIGVTALVVTAFLEHSSSARAAAAARAVALREVPASRIEGATHRLVTAKKEFDEAIKELEEAKNAKNTASESERGDAEQRFRNAQNAWSVAKQELEFEQQQFAILTGALVAGGKPRWPINYFVFGVLALVVLIFLMYGIISHDLLPSLASISVSRGLITFLITVVTVMIALILVLATVVSNDSDLAQRFSQGKEVLTMLIGVLGTIVGFYFGNPTDGSKMMALSQPIVSDSTPVGGSTIEITAVASGGRAPYLYQLVMEPKDIVQDQSGQSPKGQIRLSRLVVSPEVKQATSVRFRLLALDSDGKSATREGTLYVKPKPAGSEASSGDGNSGGKEQTGGKKQPSEKAESSGTDQGVDTPEEESEDAGTPAPQDGGGPIPVFRPLDRRPEG